MRADESRRGPDVPFRQVGPGQHSLWKCMGCNQSREAAGSRGVGILRRCAVCLAKAAAKKGAA